MTDTKPQISISNILTLLGMVFAVSSALLYTQFRTVANAEEVTKLQESDKTIKSRTRSLEVIAAEGHLIHEHIEEDIDDIHESQDKIENLLRQLIQQGSD